MSSKDTEPLTCIFFTISPTGSKRGGAKMGMLCPGVHNWAPAPLGAVTEPESSGAANVSLSELSMALIN